jgi:hypothetical protein
MRFVLECVVCGKQVRSPGGWDPAKLEEMVELMDEMGLVCRECKGTVTARCDYSGVR